MKKNIVTTQKIKYLEGLKNNQSETNAKQQQQSTKAITLGIHLNIFFSITKNQSNQSLSKILIMLELPIWLQKFWIKRKPIKLYQIH